MKLRSTCRMGTSGAHDQNGLRVQSWALKTARFRAASAFTLLEVMIAGFILFSCLFAILALLSNSLSNARLLQKKNADPRSTVASELYYTFSHTNSLSEGSGSGDLQDLDMDYDYNWNLTDITNGLCLVDVVIHQSHGGKGGDQKMQFLMFAPQMQQQGFGAGAQRLGLPLIRR